MDQVSLVIKRHSEEEMKINKYQPTSKGETVTENCASSSSEYSSLCFLKDLKQNNL